MTAPENGAPPTAGAAYPDIGKALGTDYFLIRDQLTEDKLDYLKCNSSLRRGPGPAGQRAGGPPGEAGAPNPAGAEDSASRTDRPVDLGQRAPPCR